MNRLNILSMHHLEDILLYIPFLLGQAIYIMKRAGFSMRAGRAPTRKAYIYQNWDVIGFRSVLEFLLIFMPITHFSLGQILGLFHIDSMSIPMIGAELQWPLSNPAAILGFGIASDGMFDWLIDWASRSPKVPDAIKNWLSENIQPIPLAKQ